MYKPYIYIYIFLITGGIFLAEDYNLLEQFNTIVNSINNANRPSFKLFPLTRQIFKSYNVLNIKNIGKPIEIR